MTRDRNRKPLVTKSGQAKAAGAFGRPPFPIFGLFLILALTFITPAFAGLPGAGSCGQLERDVMVWMEDNGGRVVAQGEFVDVLNGPRYSPNTKVYEMRVVVDDEGNWRILKTDPSSSGTAGPMWTCITHQGWGWSLS